MGLTVSNDDRGVRFGPDSVLSSLQVTHAGLTEGERFYYGAPPSKASIGRIQHEARGLSKDEQEKYLSFFWPESMENGLLPWEASGPLLHLLHKTCALESVLRFPYVGGIGSCTRLPSMLLTTT